MRRGRELRPCCAAPLTRTCHETAKPTAGDPSYTSVTVVRLEAQTSGAEPKEAAVTEIEVNISERSVVRLESFEATGARTSREVVAAQPRGAAKVDPAVVKPVAKELTALGLEPDLQELQRRYQGDDARVAALMRSMASSGS